MDRLFLSSGRKRHETILITGSHGFLGQHLVRLLLDETPYSLYLSGRESEALFDGIEEEPRILGYKQLDITSRAEVRDMLQTMRPDVIINAAGLVEPDRAEHEREAAWRTNVNAVEYLTEAARKIDARLIHISSDYVFDGQRAPYAEGDAPKPLNYYGRTKLASENILKTSGIEYAVVRTSSLYGAAQHVRRNFVLNAILELQEGRELLAPTNLIFAPTLVDDVALGVIRLVERMKSGLYHIGGTQMLSRYDFALMIANAFSQDAKLVKPVTYHDWVGARKAAGEVVAERPLRSGLVSLKAQTDLGLRISNPEEGLQVMIRRFQELQGSIDQFLYE